MLHGSFSFPFECFPVLPLHEVCSPGSSKTASGHFFFIIKQFFEVSPNTGYFSRYFNDNNFNFRQMPLSVE